MSLGMPVPIPPDGVAVLTADNKLAWQWRAYFDSLGQQIASIEKLATDARSNGALSMAAEALALARQTSSVNRRAVSADLPPPSILNRPPEAALPSRPVRSQWSVFQFMVDTAANLANYASSLFSSAEYLESDTYVRRYTDGSAWTEELFPALIKLLGSTSTFPALKRSSAILQARLADDSAYTDLEVLDEAYDATTWNGSLEVPTKNAVRDKVETLLIKNGVNFGPAPVLSITVVDGQITAIS